MNAILVNILISASIFLIVALGFSVIYSTARFIHFAHAAIITLGAYFLYFSISVLGLSLIPALLLSILLSTIAGISTHTLVYSYLKKKEQII